MDISIRVYILAFLSIRSDQVGCGLSTNREMLHLHLYPKAQFSKIDMGEAFLLIIIMHINFFVGGFLNIFDILELYMNWRVQIVLGKVQKLKMIVFNLYNFGAISVPWLVLFCSFYF